MKPEKEQAKQETLAIIEAVRAGGNESLLQVAALSYAKGLRDGARIERGDAA